MGIGHVGPLVLPHGAHAPGIRPLREYAAFSSVGRWPGEFPKTISGLTLWFAAHRITGLNDGDGVATWVDLSGNGYNVTQATSGNRPLYKTNIFNGLPALWFDGIDDGLENATTNVFSSGAARTTFIVAQVTASSIGVFICYRRGAPVWCYQFLDHPTWRGLYFTDGAVGASNTHSLATYITYTMPTIITIRGVGAGTSHSIRVNGYNATNGGGATPNNDTGTTGFYIGRREGSNGFHQGHIAEILAYSGAMSDADCLRIERYLAAKYWPLMS